MDERRRVRVSNLSMSLSLVHRQRLAKHIVHTDNRVGQATLDRYYGKDIVLTRVTEFPYPHPTLANWPSSTIGEILERCYFISTAKQFPTVLSLSLS